MAADNHYPPLAPIVRGKFVATWEVLPTASGFIAGGVWMRSVWVIRNGEAFVGIADTPGEVERLVRFCERKVA